MTKEGDYSKAIKITSNISVLKNGKIQIGCGIFTLGYIKREIRDLKRAVKEAQKLIEKTC